MKKLHVYFTSKIALTLFLRNKMKSHTNYFFFFFFFFGGGEGGKGALTFIYISRCIFEMNVGTFWPWTFWPWTFWSAEGVK